MYCFFLKDEYCSEEIYKYLSMKLGEKVFLGINEYDYEFRKKLFSQLFPDLVVKCCKTVADYIEIVKSHTFDEVVLSSLFGESDVLIQELMKNNCKIKFLNDCKGDFKCHTNRFNFVKKKTIKEILEEKNFVRVIETNSGLTSMLLQQISELDSEGKEQKFDAFWMSSLCDSLHRGKPDHEITDLSDRLTSFSWTQEISSLPVIFDLDSGGTTEHFLDSLISLYNRGVSAVVIEDKVGEKINSLSDKCTQQNQDSAKNFAEKIRCGRKLIKDDNFMIIARIESLIMGNSIEEAIARAEKYIEANADAILIHYNKSNLNVIKEFCKYYNCLPNRKPLVVVPTKYSFVTEEELKKWGVNIVIYANHITRSIVPAILKTGLAILKNGRALEASMNCISVAETLDLVENDLSVF